MLIGGTGTGKSHIAIAIGANCVRNGARVRFFTAVDLVNQLEAEAKAAAQKKVDAEAGQTLAAGLAKTKREGFMARLAGLFPAGSLIVVPGAAVVVTRLHAAVRRKACRGGWRVLPGTAGAASRWNSSCGCRCSARC